MWVVSLLFIDSYQLTHPSLQVVTIHCWVTYNSLQPMSTQPEIADAAGSDKEEPPTPPASPESPCTPDTEPEEPSAEPAEPAKKGKGKSKRKRRPKKRVIPDMPRNETEWRLHFEKYQNNEVQLRRLANEFEKEKKRTKKRRTRAMPKVTREDRPWCRAIKEYCASKNIQFTIPKKGTDAHKAVLALSKTYK